jgi:hypothetical protein
VSGTIAVQAPHDTAHVVVRETLRVTVHDTTVVRDTLSQFIGRLPPTFDVRVHDSTATLLIPVLSALVGSTVAFFFYVRGELWKRRYEGQIKHRNALHFIEKACQRYLNDLIPIHRLLTTFRATVADGNVTAQFAPPLDIYEHLADDVGDQDIVGRTEDVTVVARRYNHDLRALIAGYTELRQLYYSDVQHRLTFGVEYQRNADAIADGFEQQALALSGDLQPQLEELVARTRLRWQIDKPNAWKALVGGKARPLDDAEVKRALEGFMKQRQASLDESRKRLDALRASATAARSGEGEAQQS